MDGVMPKLAFCYYSTCPADRRCLASSEWFAVECLRGCVAPFTLDMNSHDVEALVVPSLGLDSMFLGNSVMSIFLDDLGWENQV